MKLLKIRFLDHYTSINNAEEMSERFYLTSIGWLAQEDSAYIRLSMVLDNDGDLTAPFMNIIKKDIVDKEVLHERRTKNCHSPQTQGVGKAVKRNKRTSKKQRADYRFDLGGDRE